MAPAPPDGDHDLPLAGAGLRPAPTEDLGLGARCGVCRALRQNASNMGALFD